MSGQNQVAKSVFANLWTPDLRYVALVLNRPETLPNGEKKGWGWSMPGGGQIEADQTGWYKVAEKVFQGHALEKEELDDLGTLFREVFEETGIKPVELKIDPESRIEIKKAKDHVLVVYHRCFYRTNNISRQIVSHDGKGKAVEARWVSCANLNTIYLERKKIYQLHFLTVNDREYDRYPYCYRNQSYRLQSN